VLLLAAAGEDLEFLVRKLGSDGLVLYTDYPHSESKADMVAEWRRRLRPLPDEVARKTLGGNAAAFLGMELEG
jgi:hypothetical protein